MPEGPPRGETIIQALRMVHSHPCLVILWLGIAIFCAAGRYIFNVAGLPVWTSVFFIVCLGLVLVFFHAGIMGSLDVILGLGGWSLAAVMESGKHYFWRFLGVGIVQAAVILIPTAIARVLLSLTSERIMYYLILLVVNWGRVALMFALVFSYPGVVVEGAGIVEAVVYSFRVVRANLYSTLSFVVVLSGSPLLISLLINGWLKTGDIGAGFLAPGLSVLLNAYGYLLLMAALVYFAAGLKKNTAERRDHVDIRCSVP
ncbi:MAG: hypothetical protein V1789_04960 [PVC group bacterium]